MPRWYSPCFRPTGLCKLTVHHCIHSLIHSLKHSVPAVLPNEGPSPFRQAEGVVIQAVEPACLVSNSTSINSSSKTLGELYNVLWLSLVILKIEKVIASIAKCRYED